MTNQPGVLELAAGLEYLSAYPHGCLEQRMSQVSPDLALGGLLKKLELDTRFTPQVQAATKRILEELKLYQDEQGFFSYWPGGRGDIALTAQGVEFMIAAKKAGVGIDDAVLKRAMEALKRVLRTDFSGLWAEYRFDQQTAALRALGRAGDLDENYLVELFNRRKGFGPVALADLTSSMAERPRRLRDQPHRAPGRAVGQRRLQAGEGQAGVRRHPRRAHGVERTVPRLAERHDGSGLGGAAAGRPVERKAHAAARRAHLGRFARPTASAPRTTTDARSLRSGCISRRPPSRSRRRPSPSPAWAMLCSTRRRKPPGGRPSRSSPST